MTGMAGWWALAGALLLGTLVGVVRLRRDGRLRESQEAGMPGEPMGGLTGELKDRLGERATLVQFSTAFCQPCRATRRVLAEVAAMVPGVAHVEIDAESRLDLVRELNVVRTPTVFVLDASGAIVKRASGTPRKADVIAALGAAIEG
ncbi:thiol-disulfide isomerase/thioredoxin [Thermocatellispora tengchongensis]|uniref:Thiol-disulfide isomerase/thioredoxin n=1 Tax=Thermocatellispora tengchongensis TaxID=1073253 RepID=A0A840PSA4_9ACTN|nr:thiol-disulfide isomerase/thioredoxin [Thermocatellispora tengchongensis]